MAQRGKQKGYVTPIEVSRAAQKVRAYRYTHRIHPTKAGCAIEMGLCRSTVIKWWDKCELSKEDIENIEAVKRWIIDNHGSDNYRKCSIDLNRDPDAIKADMAVIHEWYDDRI